MRVFLSGFGDLDGRAQVAAAAQIVWTLSQLGIPGIQIYDDNQVVTLPHRGSVQQLGDWQTYNPDGLPLATHGYFIRAGAVWGTDGKALTGRVGQGYYAARSVAVCRDLSRIAVVGRLASGAAALYVGSTHTGRLASRLTADTLTAPTWSPALDEVWTVQDGHSLVAVPWSGEPSRVSAPGLDRLGPVSALRLSRDGTRVAVVAGAAGMRRLYVGIVTRSPGSDAVESFQRVQPTLPDVLDAVWSAADQMVVLARGGSTGNALWTVPVDGSTREEMNQDGLLESPSEVAAAPNLPMLAEANGSMWSRSDRAGSWVGIVRTGSGHDQAPAYPG